MWIKKSEEKMTAEVAALRLKRILLLVLFAGWAVCYRFALLRLQTSWLLKIGLAIVGGICLAALINTRRTPKRSEVYICDRCNRVKAAGGAMECFCQGHYFPMDKMEWIEDSFGAKEDRSKKCNQPGMPRQRTD